MASKLRRDRDVSHSECLTLDFGQYATVHRWQKMPECDGFVGACRSKHTAVAYKDAVYVFGGDNGQSMLNDLLRFDVEEKSWGRAVATGTPPAPRYHHSAVVYQNGSEASMFIFGGYTGDIHSNSNLTNRNDLWEYNFSNSVWQEWHFPSGSVRPRPRSAHGAAIYDGHMIVFAGYDGNARLNDMWKVPLTKRLDAFGNPRTQWMENVQIGGDQIPPTSCNFPTAVWEDNMFVFSGQSGAKSTNSLYRFNFKSNTWTRIITDHILRNYVSPPSRRYGHTMVAFDRKLYVYGGACDNLLPSSLHAFDLDTEMWSSIPPAADSETPPGRLFHAAAVVGDAMYVFGGTVDNTFRSREMFRFQFEAFPKCTLRDDFGMLLESGQFSDVNFTVSEAETKFPAHIAVTAARSSLLRDRISEAKAARTRRLEQLFGSPSRGLSPKDIPVLEVRISDADSKAFAMVMDFIYADEIDPTKKGKIPADSDDVILTMMRVYTLAVKFKMIRLEQLCVRYLERSINLPNVLTALRNASCLKLFLIKEFCLKFIIKDSNYDKIILSTEFEILDQPLMVEIIRRRQDPNKKSVLMEDTVDYTLGTTLKDDMKEFLNCTGKEFADVTLLLNGTSIASHKSILVARSSYFEGMFRSFSPPDNEVSISIGGMIPSKQSFDSLLRYIYYGEVEMPPEDSLYLFSAPNFYIFTNNRLQVFCKYNLERNVTVDNVLQILEAADRNHAHDMKDYALSVIVRHFPEVAPLNYMKLLPKDLLLDVINSLAEELAVKKRWFKTLSS